MGERSENNHLGHDIVHAYKNKINSIPVSGFQMGNVNINKEINSKVDTLDLISPQCLRECNFHSSLLFRNI
jgi:hypothetical protein